MTKKNAEKAAFAAYVNKHPDASLEDIAAAVGVAKSTASRWRSLGVGTDDAPKLLTGGGQVVEMVPAAPVSKLKERAAELEAENEYYRQRNAELLDHIADLSMDTTRLRGLLNKQAEG